MKGHKEGLRNWLNPKVPKLFYKILVCTDKDRSRLSSGYQEFHLTMLLRNAVSPLLFNSKDNFESKSLRVRLSV